MPPFGPISRRKLVKALRKAGFDGPYSGSKHSFMEDETGRRLTIPNPHGGDLSRGLLSALLKQAGISREDWERL